MHTPFRTHERGYKPWRLSVVQSFINIYFCFKVKHFNIEVCGDQLTFWMHASIGLT